MKTLIYYVALFSLTGFGLYFCGEYVKSYVETENQRRSVEYIAKLKPLAEQGDAEAQRNLGRMYFYGRGVKEDQKEAVKWLTLAARKGDLQARKELGRKYWSIDSINLIDVDELIGWLIPAAAQGDFDAKMNLDGVISRFCLGQQYDAVVAEREESDLLFLDIDDFLVEKCERELRSRFGVTDLDDWLRGHYEIKKEKPHS